MAKRTAQQSGVLMNVPTERVRRNEDNPRLIFRSDELEELANSIQDIGIQVPINVFKEGHSYKLIDGERRWRACQMLNMETIPAIVLPKPSPVQNIVFMFNIHRYRRDWDPLPTAMKLEELADLLESENGYRPTEAELASLTGMSRGAVRRCKLIMEIPTRDRQLLLKELDKPEQERRLTTDLYIECQRSVRTIQRYLPEHAKMEEPLRKSLISKYRHEVIKNVVHMRYIAKIIRAVEKGIPEAQVVRILTRLVDDPAFGADEAYARIAWAYDLRAMRNQAESLAELIASLPKNGETLDEESRRLLKELASKIAAVLKG